MLGGASLALAWPGHRPYRRVLVNFVALYRTWWKDTRGSDWLQTFSCSSKAKINGLKELLENKLSLIHISSPRDA